MFAYVQLCSINRKKNVESAARLDYAEWGKTSRIQISHGETFDIPLHRNRLRKSRSQDPSFVRQPIEWGSRGRSPSQLRALRGATGGGQKRRGKNAESRRKWGGRRTLQNTEKDE